jgi:Flp pilus assembly protein TadD
MNSQEYNQKIRDGAALVDRGDFAGGLAVFRALIESDLPDLDKSIMSVNAAVCCDRLGRDADAVAWYDYGIALESPFERYFVAENKAVYLAGKNRKEEAITIYEEMLTEPAMQLADLERIRANLAVLRGGGQ